MIIIEKILITGASGLIGCQCIDKLLKEDIELHGTYNCSENLDSKVIWHKVNLLNLDDAKRIIDEVQPDKLLHLAWLTSDFNNIENVQWARTSFELIKHFYETGGKRAVVAGTCFEYDLNYNYLVEDKTPRNANSIYGLSKNYLHDILKLYCEQNNLSWGWGRIYYLYGPNEKDKRLVPYVIKQLLRGEKAVCSSGEQFREYLYSKDVAEAFIKLLYSDFEGAVNISSCNPVKVKEIVLEIANILEKSDLLEFNPSLNKENDPPIITGSNKLLKSIGWKQEYSLSQGIKETIEWWRKQI